MRKNLRKNLEVENNNDSNSSKKANRWQKRSKSKKKTIDNIVEDDDVCESKSDESRDSLDISGGSCGVSLDSLLFYSPKIAQTIDDKEVFEYVQLAYPDFDNDYNEKEFRKVFLNFLSETLVVENILEKYNYSMMDLISLFYRQMPYLFTTKTYISKVRELIAENYADCT